MAHVQTQNSQLQRLGDEENHRTGRTHRLCTRSNDTAMSIDWNNVWRMIRWPVWALTFAFATYTAVYIFRLRAEGLL